MNTECQETRSPQTGREMGSPPQDAPPPARPRLTMESKAELRKAEMEVKKLFLAEEERKTIELLKTTNLSMAAQQRAHHRRMTTVKPFNFRNIFNTSVAAENPPDVTREKELKERAERQGNTAILKADFDADKSFWDGRILNDQKIKDESAKLMKANARILDEERARCRQRKACEVHIQPSNILNFSRTSLAEKDPPNEMREKELKERAERQGKAAILRADFEAAELFREEENLKARRRRENNMEHMKFNMNMVAEQQTRRQQMKIGEIAFKPSNLTDISKSSLAAEDPTNEMREKELKERAERQGKAAILKADIEAAELFREEEKLKARKKQEINVEHMKFNMSMAAEQRARQQQMKAAADSEASTKTAPQPKHSTSNTCWPRKLKF